MENKNVIKQYIYRNRNGQRQRVGLLVGMTVRNRIVLGYSLCSKEDVFDAETAMVLAASKALSPQLRFFPQSIESDAVKFLERCKRYFNDAHYYEYVG